MNIKRKHYNSGKKVFFNNKWVILTSCFLFVGIIFLSIGYSAFSSTMLFGDISAAVRLEKNIRITGVQVDSSLSTSDVIFDDVDYNIKKVSSSFNLPNADSQIVFDVEVKNLGDTQMGILKLEGLDSRLTYSLVDYNLGDVLCSSDNTSCNLGVTKNFKVVLKYKADLYDAGNTSFNTSFDLAFESFHDISYEKITGSSSMPSKVINRGKVSINLDAGDVDNITVFSGGRELISGIDYLIEGTVLTINNVTNDLKICTEFNYFDGVYPPASSITDYGLTVTSLGNGEFIIDGTVTNINTYIRLSYELGIDNVSPANLVDGNTIIESGGKYHFEYTELGGSYSGITGPNQMKFVMRGVNSAFALPDFGYDPWIGYYGVQDGYLSNSLGMLSCWVKASEDTPVTFDNYRFKIDLTNVARDESSLYGEIESTVTDGNITIDYYESGLYVINGTTVNNNNYLRLDGSNSLISSDMKKLYNDGYTLFESGHEVKVVYSYVKNAPTIPSGKDLTILFRDDSSNVSAVNDIKMSVSGNSGIKFSLTDNPATASATLSKNVSFLSMYIPGGIIFNNYSFFVTYEEIE